MLYRHKFIEILLLGSGNGLATAAFSLALNTYFNKKRNKAVGIAMTITGFGPILYPPLITMLLTLYGVQGCVLILGAIGTHIFMAAALLQPIRSHLIYDTNGGGEASSVPVAYQNPSSAFTVNFAFQNNNYYKWISVTAGNSSVWDYTSEEEDDYLEKPLKEDDVGRRMVNFNFPPQKLDDSIEVKNSIVELYEPKKYISFEYMNNLNKFTNVLLISYTY